MTMKNFYGFYNLLRTASQHPDETISFIEWAFGAAIDAVVISVIVAWIAKQCGEEFKDWFLGSCVVVFIIDFILYLIA